MRNPFLIGEQIYLRPVELADASLFVQWLNDVEIARFTLRYRPLTLIEEEEFIRKAALSETDTVLAIALRASEALIGITGLHQLDNRNRHAGFGITIGEKSLWDKGHGTAATRLMLGYAFDTLNLNRVWLHVYEYNLRGVRVYEKAGFQIEGRLRQDTFRDGRYWDTLVMAALRDDWRSRSQ